MLDDIRLAIFDHSGVLSDDRPPVYEANMVLLQRRGTNRITFEDWLRASKASAADLVESFGHRIDRASVSSEYAEVYSDIVVGGLAPTMYVDVPEVLDQLKENSIRLGIVSSHPTQNLITELGGYGIRDLFDDISGADGDPVPKNKRLVQMCGGFSFRPDQAVFVEDTIYGLQHGKDAGVHTIGVTTGYHNRERLEAEKPYAVLDSLKEILDYIA
jgi:phosphoglycolate phosphatase